MTEHSHETPVQTATTTHADLAWTISSHDEAVILSGCVTPLEDGAVTTGMMTSLLQGCHDLVQEQNGLVGHFKANFETEDQSCTISITTADAQPNLTGAHDLSAPLIDEGFFTLIALLIDANELEQVLLTTAQTVL